MRTPTFALIPLALLACGGPAETTVEMTRTLPTPEVLEHHCAEHIGEPRVEEVVEGVWLAIGYDLASTILVQTDAGNVVIDTGMSPSRARPVHEALQAVAPGPTAAIVYTHTHIDHVGGATVWAEEGTRIWATDAFVDRFFKQYGVFRDAESARGVRQFGSHVDRALLPCSALGAVPDVAAATEVGVLMPTDTFTGSASFEVGGVTFELREAHGETDDQLYVWLPDGKVLLPGDNYYRTFPNLYTIRGTTPRPVTEWIASLDEMRRLEPEVMIPAHTVPVVGAELVQRELTDYRDGIQWVRDATVRGANAGQSVEEIAASVGLPPHLAEVDALAELYGQIDWSVQAIYDGQLGWFDGDPEDLYRLPPSQSAPRYVALMGGAGAVLDEADRAAADGDPMWALELLALVEDSGAATPAEAERLAAAWPAVLQQAGESVANTNGRGYLLESALERSGPVPALPEPVLSDGFVEAIPVALLFEILAQRLMPERSMDVHESVVFEFEDRDAIIVTVRHGVAEVVEGQPLPGTPAPVATVHTTSSAWRRIALQKTSAIKAIAAGELSVEGDRKAFLAFMQRFRRGI